MRISPQTLDLLDLLWVNFMILTFTAFLCVGIAIGMTEIEIYEMRNFK
jgi:hypothetical protein